MVDVTPELLLSAYEAGIFPMAESADDPSLYWVEPERRGILPLDAFHVPRRLKRTVRLREFEIRVDSNFDGVILGCAASAPGRRKTWINTRIRELYGALFRMGKCHTVECWCDGSLVGGLYGVKIGRAFFGESMFSQTRDASKVALIHLAGRLRAGGFVLLDTQFVTDHLSQFGAMEVNRREYRKLLANALSGDGNFYPWPEADSPSLVLQSISQTS